MLIYTGKSGGRASQGGKVGRAGTSTETSATAAGCTDAMGAVKIEPDGEFANAVDRASFAMDVDE